jgi:hypothetical protein
MGVMPMTKDVQAVRDYVEDFTPAGGTAGHIGAAWGLYALTPAWNNTFDHPAGKPQSFDETTEKYLVIMTDGEFNSQKDPNMDDDEMYKYFQSVCGKARQRVFASSPLVFWPARRPIRNWLNVQAIPASTIRQTTACNLSRRSSRSVAKPASCA